MMHVHHFRLRQRIALSLMAVAVLAPAWPAMAAEDPADLGRWVTYYYLQPDPNNVPARIRQMSAFGILREERDIASVIAFLAEIFRQNPTKIGGWLADLGDLPVQDRRHLLQAVWESNTVEGRAALAGLNAATDREFLAEIQKEEPLDLSTSEITSPGQLDMLWAAFLASGKSQPVERIIDVLGWAPPKTTVAMLIQGAARWSLASNAFQHERVYQICKERLPKLSPELQKSLSEILKEVDERRTHPEKEKDAT
jgi:hypothetical protein